MRKLHLTRTKKKLWETFDSWCISVQQKQVFKELREVNFHYFMCTVLQCNWWISCTLCLMHIQWQVHSKMEHICYFTWIRCTVDIQYRHKHTHTKCLSSLGAFGWLRGASVNIRCSHRLSHPSSDAITPHLPCPPSSPLLLFPNSNSFTLQTVLSTAPDFSTVPVFVFAKGRRMFQKDAFLACT